MKFYRLICMLAFFAFLPAHRAQPDSAMQFTQQQWKEVSKGVDYTETYAEMKEDKQKDIHYKTSSEYLSGLKYVFYILILGLLVFIIVRIFKNYKNNGDVKNKAISIEAIHEIEDNLHEVNLDDLLKEALHAKNYRIALRLNFLIIIKLLSQKGHIDWAKEKTNWEYHSEIKDKLLADQFKEAIKSFEMFWYGEHAFTEQHYHVTEPLYTALQKRLSPHE